MRGENSALNILCFIRSIMMTLVLFCSKRCFLELDKDSVRK